MKKLDLQKALGRYHRLLVHEEKLRKRYDAIHASREKLAEEIYTIMEAKEFQSVETAAGTFYRREDLYCSAQDKPVLFAWLRENGHENLIREEVNSRTLTALYKELSLSGGTLPPGVGITIKKRIGFRSA